MQKKDSEAEIMINVYKDKRIRHKSPSNNKIEILNTVKMDAKNISKLKKMSIETPSLKRPECNSPKNSKKMNLHRKSNSSNFNCSII